MTANSSIDRIVFCDFDGTITAEETFVSMFFTFNPELFKRIGKDAAEGRITLREAVCMILESLESSVLPKIRDFVRAKPLRPGFPEFLGFLEERDIPFVIISGGLRAMIEARLEGYLSRVRAVYAIDLDDSGEYLKPLSDYQDGGEMVGKAMIMERYNARRPVAIGDGITDYAMALRAPVVFARDHLAQHMEKHGKPYIPWNDFFDVIARLREMWGG